MRTDLITPNQAAKQLSVSTETLRRWALEGRLQEFRTGDGGHRRYLADEVQRLSPVNKTEPKVGSEVIVGYARVSSHVL